jgi:hypothetical protein
MRGHEYRSGTGDKIRTTKLEVMTNNQMINIAQTPASLFCIGNLFMVTFLLR